MKVLKFGGTSVKNAERIAKVRDIVAETLKENKKVVVVVSALGGLTDVLIGAAKKAEAGDDTFKDVMEDISYRHRKTADQLFSTEEMKSFRSYLRSTTNNLENLLFGTSLIKELSPRSLDRVMSYGEIMSSYIVAHFFAKSLPNVEHIDSREIIKTNDDFGNAQVDFEKTNANIAEKMGNESGVYVMGGFIASTDDNVTTTLGRGGSDFTAAIIGAGLGANEIEIWTDVDGVMTADPRKVKKAFSLTHMTYEEAMEMSHFGAKVIHPPTVQPALDKKIPIRIRNTFNSAFEGTLITSRNNADYPVKGISSISDISLMTVQGSGLIGVTGIAGRLFTVLARHRVNITLITQASSEHSITFAVKPTDTEKAKKAIEEEFLYEIRSHLINDISVENNLAIVAVIGSGMKNMKGISGRTFRALGANGVNIRAIAQGSSELNISSVISKNDIVKSLNALHETFFLSDTKSIHLFVVGATGLIGTTLLEQINKQQQFLAESQSLELKLVAVTNSRQMFFDVDGLNLTNWNSILEQKGNKANLQTFIENMKALNLPNTIFIDCTASATPIKHYADILSSSISIVTPNKIANSSSLQNYVQYQKLAKKYNVKFLYETNVGAGLPVISTLKGLLQSGDEILQIDAVLSGSLSFIFNSFSDEKRFSDVVKQAQDKGFTEPDPRDDLSGRDVARKVLILSREIGKNIEIDDIEVENILPQACLDAKNVADFFEALAANDDYFAEMRNKASKAGKVLRFLASVTPQKASVSLQAVDSNNPFYSLSGSDNMIVFKTARYLDRPLVVKGPGAGAAVTAAGVFAEIISISNYLNV
ncbi:MAG: bifunctional aspartate kinase/homoserine dehydrogenase I [Chitinophagales bacterium]